MKGVVFVISSPTGAGKTTLCEIIQKRRNDVERVITHTTRKPREGEKNGVDYYFVDRETFEEMIKRGEFVEYAVVHNNFYGTSKKALNDVVESGKNPLLAIDVQGAKNIMDWIDRVVSVFILPPSFEEWLKRLERDRERDNINIRLKTAIKELSAIGLFDYCIVNNELENSVNKLNSIIDSSLIKVSFFGERFQRLAEELRLKTKEFLEVKDGKTVHV